MTMLKKRPVAIIITVFVIILSTFFSVQRTLGSKCREVSDSFYLGVYDKDWGSTRRSVSSQLDKRLEASNGLVSIAANYESLTTDANAVREARDLLRNNPHVGGKYEANKALDERFKNLAAALEQENLSERERTALESYVSTFRGAQSVIDSSGYNEAVRAFERDTLQVFPTNFLKAITFIKEPELFE